MRYPVDRTQTSSQSPGSARALRFESLEARQLLSATPLNETAGGYDPPSLSEVSTEISKSDDVSGICDEVASAVANEQSLATNATVGEETSEVADVETAVGSFLLNSQILNADQDSDLSDSTTSPSTRTEESSERLDACFEPSNDPAATPTEEEVNDDLLEDWNEILESICEDRPISESEEDSGDASGSGGSSSGGSNDDLAPFVSGGFQNACLDYVFSADDSSSLTRSCSWFVNPSSNSLYYSVQNSLDFVEVSIDSYSGSFIITPTGRVGSGVFTIVASNGYGSCALPVHVYSGRVVGYSVEERVYGGDWGTVGDSGYNWDLLWKNNEYRWKPIFENNIAPASQKVQVVNLQAYSYDVYGPYLAFANSTTTHYCGSSGGSDYRDDPDWPYAVGCPNQFGEQGVNITLSLRGGDVDHGVSYCLDNNAASLSLSCNSQYCPRIAVNAVQSLTWTSIDSNNSINLGINPNNSSGMRCFPEQADDQPDSSGASPAINNTINVKVTLNAAVPNGMQGSVYLNYFDPINALGTNADLADGLIVGQRDNRGTARLATHYLYWTSDSPLANSTTLTIDQAYAGDNYIVAAHPSHIVESSYYIVDSQTGTDDNPTYSSQLKRASSSDESNELVALGSNLQTSVLTVWRTLWVERDSLTYSDTSNNEVVADNPPIDGIVASEMGRACVLIREYTRNVTSSLNGYLISLNPNDNNCIVNYCNNGVDTPTSNAWFWTVRTIGAFKIVNDSLTDNQRRLGRCQNGTVFIANETIEYNVSARNQTINTSVSSEPLVDVNYVKQVVTLHELGHYFGLVHQTDGVMNATVDLANIADSFTIENLRTIQSQDMPPYTNSQSNN